MTSSDARDLDARPLGFADIELGWDVFDLNGDKLGTVSDVQPGIVTVSKGFLFPTDRYIPESAIDRIELDRVWLALTRDDIDARGWDEARVGSITEEVLRATGAELDPAPPGRNPLAPLEEDAPGSGPLPA